MIRRNSWPKACNCVVFKAFIKTVYQKIKNILQRIFNGFNLSPTTAAIPLTPGRLVMRDCVLSSGICEDNLFPEYVHARSCKFPFSTNTLFPWFGIISRLDIFGRKRGFFITIWRSCGYQDCAYNIGVIKIKVAGTIATIFKTQPIRKKGGKA